MSFSLRDLPEEMADIATKIARIFYRKNNDHSLEYEDFLQEVLIELAKISNRYPDNPALTWRIGTNTAIDLLRYGERRAHLSLNDLVEDGEGNTVEWVDLKENEQANMEMEEVLYYGGFEQSTPRSFQLLIYKRIAGYPLSATERKRLSRARKEIDVTIWEELFDIA